MAGGDPSAEQQISQLRHDLTTVLDEQRSLERAVEEYICGEARALALLDGQRSGQKRCRRLILEKIEALRTIQDEIDALVPQPRVAE